MKILITGAFGLIGSNICKVLERDYPDIEIEKVKGTILDDGLVNPILDCVIYAAGYGQPLKFLDEKITTINFNTIDVQRIFKYLKPQGKFLFISSSEIYSGAKLPYKETDIGTITPQHPRACYIEGKRCGEAICMAFKEQGYDVKIARLALAYGEGTKKGDTRVLNQFIEQALTTGEIKVKDAGEAIRTYGYVEDVAKQLLNILFKGKDVVYNVGGQSTTTIAALALKIGELTGAKVSFGSDKIEGAPDNVKLDLTKVLTEFPMNFISLEEGLKRTINYQKQLWQKF